MNNFKKNQKQYITNFRINDNITIVINEQIQ